MTAPASVKKTAVQVRLSSDRQRAWVRFYADPTECGRLEDEIIAALQRAGVLIDADVHRRVARLASDCHTHPLPPPDDEHGYLVALGRPPVEAVAGRFEWADGVRESRAEVREGDPVDHFGRQHLVTVPAGTVLGRRIPPRDGVVGRDVCGRPVAPRCAQGAEPPIGSGVQPLTPEGDVLVAAVAGRPTDEGGVVHVVEQLKIDSDVDFNTGSIDVCVDVDVCGTVRSGFHVYTTGRLSIGKALEAAEVRVSRDLNVDGGILGHHEDAPIRVGGRVTALYAELADLQCGGDLCVERELLNCRMMVGGACHSPGATVIGGALYAREGLHAQALGSECGRATVVAVGPCAALLRDARAIAALIKEHRRTADTIGSRAAPLAAHLKHLTPAQGEQLRALLAQAAEIEDFLGALEERRGDLLTRAQPRGTPAVVVEQTIHAGVSLVFGEREARVSAALPGPLRVALAKVSGVTEVVAVNSASGNRIVLPSAPLDASALPSLQIELERSDDAHDSASA